MIVFIKSHVDAIFVNHYRNSGSNNTGFFQQTLVVANELKSSHLNYELRVHSPSSLPHELIFKNKKYLIDENINPATLAIVDFLAKHTQSRLEFESALAVFAQLYLRLFQTDPVQNRWVQEKY